MIPSSYDGEGSPGQNSPAETRLPGMHSQPKTADSEGVRGGLLGRWGSAPAAVLGVDASLVAMGLVAVPVDWGGDWTRVASRTFGWSLPSGASDRARIERLERLAAAAVAFAAEHDCTIAAIESFPFGKVQAAHALGEASGVIKVGLHVAGLNVRTAPISTARRQLLGHLPRTGAKIAVRDRLVTLGAPFRTLDECDAMCAGLWALRGLGAFAFQEAS